MIQYLAWRVLKGKHKKITYSFMVPGHTKFSPDGFFGLFKLKLKNSEVDDLEDLVRVVETSTSRYNCAQTIYDKENKRMVFFFKWSDFLKNYFNQIPGLLQYHHFIFEKENPGIIKVKKTIDGEIKLINILKNNIINNNIILEKKYPKGLTPERQWYLYEEVREHIQDPEKRDIYCSLPNVPKPKKVRI